MLLKTAAVLMVAATVVLVAGEPPDRWETVDVEPILKNERLLKTYFKCIMDQGRCSPDAAEVKRHIPEVLRNDCSDCSKKKKENINKVVKYILNKKPDMFKQLEEKYDPQRTYRKRYHTEGGEGDSSSIFAAKEALLSSA